MGRGADLDASVLSYCMPKTDIFVGMGRACGKTA